jgi:hypothetical protein
MRRLLGFALLAAMATGQAPRPAIPSPEQFFGFRIGTDRKLARYDKIVAYFQKVAAGSDRIRFRNLGLTTGGNPFVMLEISSPSTIRNLERYKTLEQKLYFQAGLPTAEQRDQIFREGKAVVLITNNIHSTEIGSSQTAIELAYRLATEDSPVVRKILDNVIFLLTPSVNPDGQIMVTDWYNKYLGTPQEGTSPPFLYHVYAGHDNNRDMFLFSQKETQMMAQVLWHDWFPAIWLDQHQQGNAGARMFTMPATDPINPNVHPLIYRLNTIFGQMQAAALEAAGKDGIMHNSTYTSFWEGAMAWTGWWHNEVGLLTEAASARIATPVVQQFATADRPGIKVALIGPDPASLSPDLPLPPPRDVTPRSDYPRPWLGGTWGLRDIVDYELISTMALLESAADYRETLLRQIYDINLNTVEAGRKGAIGFGDKEPEYGVIIPIAGQQDQNEVIELVEKLRTAGVEVYRSRQEFKANGLSWAAGTYVVPFTQVFARYAKDLLEVQTYPAALPAVGSTVDAPYDVSAWSLGMQFGVKTVFAHEPLPESFALDSVNTRTNYVLTAEKNGAIIRFPYAGAESAVVVNRLLKNDARVSMLNSTIQVQATPQAWTAATRGFDVTMKNTAAAAGFGTPLHQPRVGLYQSWTANIDEGWTRWIFERYEFPYTTLHNADVQGGGLRAKFDAIVLPDQTARSLLEGQSSASIPAEYRGGLGDRGWLRLREFVDQGGTLIALGDASNLLVERMPLPVRELKRTVLLDQHDGPGTILNLQVDTTLALGWGMAPETFGFYTNSPFFQLTDGFTSQKARVVARYPNMGVVASGWMRGEEFMLGRAAVVAVETNPGKVVLFGIRPQHRAQSHATLPLLFNSLYWSAEGDLGSAAQ